jgi:AcrR family transcriptional regulator
MSSQLSPPRPSPREKYRLQLRTAILRAAREAFTRKGYEGVSMRLIAEKVGCSHPNLYLHFKNKEEIFDCLVEQSFQKLAEGMRELDRADGSGDCLERLRKGARAYVAFGLRNPGAYEFAFVLRRPGAPASHKPHLAYEYLRTMVARCIDEKRITGIDVDVAAQAAWAAVHGVTSLLLFRASFPWTDKEKVIAQVIDGAIDSLVAPSSRRR